MNAPLKGAELATSAEINFTIQRFHALPCDNKKRLANAIRNNAENSKEYREAGIEIFKLIVDADVKELTAYMNTALFGTDHTRGVYSYLVMSEGFTEGTWRCAQYFREHLSLELDSFEVMEIDIPEPQVQA